MHVALRPPEDTGGVVDTPLIDDTRIRHVFLTRDPASGAGRTDGSAVVGNFTDDTVEKLFRAFEERDLY
jgi:hypothetical protein